MKGVEWMALVLYAVGSLGLLADLIRQQRKFRKYAAVILAVGFGMDAVGFFLHISGELEGGALPFFGPSDSFRALAWVLMAASLLIHVQRKLFSMAAALAPLATICALVARILPEQHVPTVKALSELTFGGHIVTLFIGMGGLVVAFLAGLFYLIQQRELKSKRLGKLFAALPPLETLDRLVVRSLLIGVIFLTVGIVTGIYLAHEVWEKQWTQDPKVIFSLVTWGWYLLLLGVRYRVGWRGPRFFTLLVVGFCFLVFTFLGVAFFFRSGLQWI